MVDPDAWLHQIDGTTSVRKLNPSGRIRIGGSTYFVSRQYRGQEITLKVDARAQEWDIFYREQRIKRVAMKGLIQAVVPFAQMVQDLCTMAEREDGRRRDRERRRRAPRRNKPRAG